VKVVYRRTFASDGPFDREFRGIQKFTPISRSHPGFVNILHVGRNNAAGYFYYIMELGDDETTGQQIDPGAYQPKNLAREIERRGRLPAAECLQLSLALTAALDCLHRQQLIHRDIKPSNIIFVNGASKIADIGLVTQAAENGGDATYIGTEGYIPPEGPGTRAADVYSLGKVLYETSMGRRLTHFPELPTTLIERPDCQELLELNEIILKACENSVSARYPSAGEMHADLARLQTKLETRQR
jgi:serine/threonine protein kinase